MKEQVLEFMNKHDYCVISSVNSAGKPESALVAFSNNNRLEIIIGTSNKTRKYRNILQNSSVSIVIADETGSVQYEGRAKEVSHDNLDKAIEQHFAKLPGSKKYRSDVNQRYIVIEPNWIRYIEHGDVDLVNEITEFA